MNLKELYVVCQIDDFDLKVILNSYLDNKVQVLYKESITCEEFANKGEVVNPEIAAKYLKKIISNIEQNFKINISKVSLVLPSNNLKIYQSQASLEFQDLNHQISSNDINKLIISSQNISISKEEIISSVKPYNFKVNNKNYYEQFPINVKSQNISVETLVYTVPKSLYDSHLKVLELSGYTLSSVVLENFALLFGLNKSLANKKVIIDWNFNSTSVNIFVNSTLYATKNIEIGFNNIVAVLMKKMKCTYSKAEKYLTKIININSNYLGYLVIDKYYDNSVNKYVEFSKDELQYLVKNTINNIIDAIEVFLSQTINISEYEIIFSGVSVNSIPGFTSYLKKYIEWDIMFINNHPLLNHNYEWLKLIGITYYQYNFDILNNKINNKPLDNLVTNSNINKKHNWQLKISC